jgi:hypothetical protein
MTDIRRCNESQRCRQEQGSRRKIHQLLHDVLRASVLWNLLREVVNKV